MPSAFAVLLSATHCLKVIEWLLLETSVFEMLGFYWNVLNKIFFEWFNVNF